MRVRVCVNCITSWLCVDIMCVYISICVYVNLYQCVWMCVGVQARACVCAL